MRPEDWGRGLAREAAHAAIAYGFERRMFDPIRCSLDVPNVASLRLAERLGFRETHRGPGPAWEQVHFELARADFEGSEGAGAAR